MTPPDNRDDMQTAQTGQEDLQRDFGTVAAGVILQRQRIVTRESHQSIAKGGQANA